MHAVHHCLFGNIKQSYAEVLRAWSSVMPFAADGGKHHHHVADACKFTPRVSRLLLFTGATKLIHRPGNALGEKI